MEAKSLARRIPSLLNEYFFRETRSWILGILRIILVLFCLYFNHLHHPIHSFAFVNEELASIQKPSLLMQLFSVPFPLGKAYVMWFAGIYYAAAFCALVGLVTRPALLLYSLMSIYLFDIQASRGFFDHESSLITQVLLILAVAPGSTRFTMGRLLRWQLRTKRRDKATFYQAMVGKPTPVWGFKTILILLACTYFTAGFSKLRYGGLRWFDGQTLTYYLDGRAHAADGENKPMFIGPREVPAAEKWRDGFGIYSYTYGNRQEDKSGIWLGKALASHPVVMSGLSIATVVFELGGFIILLSGWPRVLYLLGAIGMHNFIGLLMNLPFTEYQILCFFCVDWYWVYQQLHARIRRRLDPVGWKLANSAR